VATGHQADDVAETVLLRLLRGAAVTGLGAMAPARPLGESVRLVRPLLEVRRHELRSYLESRGQEWRRDSSNRDTRYTRNRIRHELIPALEADYPTFSVESLAGLNESALEVARLLSDLADRLWRDSCRTDEDDEVVLETGALAAAPAAVRKVTAARAVSRLEPEAPLRAEHYAELAALPGRPVGAQVALPGEVFARREHGMVYFARRKPAAQLPCRWLDIPGQVAVPEAGLRIECAEAADEVDAERARAKSSKWQVFVARKGAGQRFSVRGRQAGDRFHPLGAPGERKLKEFLIDARVPRHERDSIPLVLAEDGRIAWVVGLRIGEPFRLPPGGAPALRLRAVQTSSSGR
jgi:tRNA(Ile)-lysidine synthase